MMRINVLLLGSLLSLVPASFSQFAQPPCRCDGTDFFQFNQATICNWQWDDQWDIFIGQDFQYLINIPFGACTSYFNGNMRCVCEGAYMYMDEEGYDPPVPVMWVHPVPQTVIFPPGAIIITEWPYPNDPCFNKQPMPPAPYAWWYLFQQIDQNANKIGPYYCFRSPDVLPWTDGVQPLPKQGGQIPWELPPGWGWPTSSGARAASTSASLSDSPPSFDSLNQTEIQDSLRQWVLARRNRTSEASKAWEALESDDSRINKEFVRSMILKRNLTRPTAASN